jgi:hypothetical protein
MKSAKAAAKRLTEHGVRTTGVVLAKHVVHRRSSDHSSTRFVVIVRFDATLPTGARTGVVKEMAVTATDHAVMLPGTTTVEMVYDATDPSLCSMAKDLESVLSGASLASAGANCSAVILTIFFLAGVGMCAGIMTMVGEDELGLAVGLALGLGLALVTCCASLGRRSGRAVNVGGTVTLVPEGGGAAAAGAGVAAAPSVDAAALARSAAPASSAGPHGFKLVAPHDRHSEHGVSDGPTPVFGHRPAQGAASANPSPDLAAARGSPADVSPATAGASTSNPAPSVPPPSASAVAASGEFAL